MLQAMITYIGQLPWGAVILLCATLGLAPFFPPHIVEKIVMLAQGELKKPLDWFDLVLHGIPWVLLMLKLAVTMMKKV